ncbi:MAG: BON domain-containing protein [Bryobacteraceae bacterium]
MKRFLVAAVMAASLLASAGLADQKTDNRISDQVRMRLATDPDVKGGALDVTVHDGVVILKGRVDTAKGKRKATKLTHKVKGVKKVENDLAVGPPS